MLGSQKVAQRNSLPEVLMRGAQLQSPAWVSARVMLKDLGLEQTCGFGGIRRSIQVRAAEAFLAGEQEPEDKMHRLAVFSPGVGPKAGLKCRRC